MERASQRINQIYLVGVDSDTEEARVGVDKLVNISDPQVPQDRGVIEVSQVGHVGAAVELGRIDLPNLILLPDFFLCDIDLILFLCDIIVSPLPWPTLSPSPPQWTLSNLH